MAANSNAVVPHEIAGGAPSGSTQLSEVLHFSQVTVSFDNTPALTDISIDVRPRDTVVLFGAAGSGKTVLLKTAIGLICPDRGLVRLFGDNVTKRREEELFSLRQRVGVLFQEGALFDSMTVRENVEYPLRNLRDQKLPASDVKSRAKEALEFVDLAAVMEKFPSELSGGMRRRVGIARASVARPPLILYDSPTAGLDPITAYRIIALVIQERDTRNATSIVVTHRIQDGYLLENYAYNPQTRKLARVVEPGHSVRFCVLREGRTVFLGSGKELRSSTDPYVSRFAGKRLSTSGIEPKPLPPLPGWGLPPTA